MKLSTNKAVRTLLIGAGLWSFLCFTPANTQAQGLGGSSAREIPNEVQNGGTRVDQVIERAEAYFKQGVVKLSDGKRESARLDFDHAIDEILLSGLDVRRNQKLEKYYLELVERIYREEVPLIQQRSISTPVVTPSPIATPTPSAIATPAPKQIIGFRQGGFDPSPNDPLSKLILQDKSSDDSNTIKYRARKGDTIAKIAAAHSLSADSVSRLNGIPANAELQPGQEIKLPVIVTELGKLHSEYISTTKEYKASLEQLLTMYQESEKKAEQLLTDGQKRFDDGMLSKRELEQSRIAVSNAKLKIDEVRQQIATADSQIKQAEDSLRQEQIDLRQRQIKEARDRERADELVGPKPPQSANGSIPVVMKWFQDHLHDPYSARYVHWSKVQKGLYAGEPYWIVEVRLRAKNAFNAYRLSEYIFYIRHNRVVSFNTD